MRGALTFAAGVLVGLSVTVLIVADLIRTPPCSLQVQGGVDSAWVAVESDTLITDLASNRLNFRMRCWDQGPSATVSRLSASAPYLRGGF